MIFYIISLILGYTLLYVVGKTLYIQEKKEYKKIKFPPIAWILAMLVLLIPIVNFLIAVAGWLFLTCATLVESDLKSSCWLFKIK